MTFESRHRNSNITVVLYSISQSFSCFTILYALWYSTSFKLQIQVPLAGSRPTQRPLAGSRYSVNCRLGTATASKLMIKPQTVRSGKKSVMLS